MSHVSLKPLIKPSKSVDEQLQSIKLKLDELSNPSIKQTLTLKQLKTNALIAKMTVSKLQEQIHEAETDNVALAAIQILTSKYTEIQDQLAQLIDYIVLDREVLKQESELLNVLMSKLRGK